MAAPTIEELLALPVETRLAIIEALEASLVHDQPISDEDRALLEERLRDAEANPDASIPWDVVRAELFAGK